MKNIDIQKLENTEWAIINGQCRETGRIETKNNKAKTQHNMCWAPLCANENK
jgi:hypothetical protein